jgi:hypothetical protein
MKNKLKISMGVFLLLFIVGGIFTSKTCLAASAVVEISADTSTVTIGDNVFVYITINSDTLIGDFEANLTYDEDVLEYLGGASVITGSSGFLKISDMNVTEGSKNRKYTLKFEALQVGTSKVEFNNAAMVNDFESGQVMSSSSNVLTLEVKAAETASTNAYLKSLKTSPVAIEPAFDKNTFEYKVNVANETEQLIIDALPEDKKASVSISGNDFLKEGENKVIVTVLAESGDIIEYTINVIRAKAPDDETSAEDITNIPASSHQVFDLVLVDGEKFAVYSGRYKIITPSIDVTIPDGYVATEMKISGIDIPVYSPENDMTSDFLLIYAMNESGEEGFYQYDRIEKTLQRYVPLNENGLVDDTDTNNDNIMQSEEYRSNLNKAAVVIAILSILCVLFMVVIIRLLFKLKGYRGDDLN